VKEDKEFKEEYRINECSDACQCGDPEIVNGPAHSCPFSEEINDNYDEVCRCCSSCQHECYTDT